MPPDSRRRSSRIPEQLAIFLIGSDIEGRVFSEETKTVVLSRHGAGITSQYKLSAEQEIIIRSVDSGKEAEACVVGQIGAQGDTYIYGVAFLDAKLDFWGLDFGELTDLEKEASRATLECSSCLSREPVDHSDLEADVFAINQSAVRYCRRCGSSTIWKRAAGRLAESSAPTRARSPVAAQATAEAEPPGADLDVAAARLPRPAQEAGTLPASARTRRPPSEPESLTPAPSAAQSPVTPARPQAPSGPEDRRKHSRARVKFKASIRRPRMPDDVVSCEDMSRGGLRFKSKKQYFASTMIEVAVPYTPGGNPSSCPLRSSTYTKLRVKACSIVAWPTSNPLGDRERKGSHPSECGNSQNPWPAPGI